MSILILNAELAANQLQDVLLAGGRVAWMSPTRDASDLSSRQNTKVALNGALPSGTEPIDEVVDAEGGALLPGLHDHHIHLLSLAESLRSVAVGPQDIADADDLQQKLREAEGEGKGEDWIRAVGYHESVAGNLTRDDLDEIVRNRPVRVQHTSGAMWMLNTLGMELLGISESTPGAELDESGRATGRLFRKDELLRSEPLLGSLPESHAAASRDSRIAEGLTGVGIMLANFGVTGVTDATPGYGDAEVGFFRDMAEAGVIPQRLTLMPSVERVSAHGSQPKTSAAMPMPHVSFGPHKIILSDHSLPAFSEVADEVRAAHSAGRPVAVHSVTRASLALLLAVLREVGSLEGDRAEHASVAPPELVSGLREQGVRVVVQPHFIAERGDRYLSEVESEDLPWLYRCQGFLDAGLRVAGGTDAPFGQPNPWLAIRAAVSRETQPGGQVIAPQEKISADQARDLFLSPPDDPGGKTRRVREGMAADLCLLHEPWGEVARSMSENPVRFTWIGGRQEQATRVELGGIEPPSVE